MTEGSRIISGCVLVNIKQVAFYATFIAFANFQDINTPIIVYFKP